MHCGQLPALLLPPLSPEKDRGRAGPGRDGPGREAAATAARGSGPPSAALSHPRPRSAPAPGDAPPRAAASAAAAAAAAGTEQVRRGEARRGGAGRGRRAGRGSGRGLLLGTHRASAWPSSQCSLLQLPLPVPALSPSPPELGRWPTQPGPHPEAWNGAPPPALTHALQPVLPGCCPPLLCQSRSLRLHSPGTPDSPLRCLHDPSPLSPVPRFLPAASLPTSSPLDCAREPLS